MEFKDNTKSARKSVFPAGFFWGAATSAHQVEGGNQNDWTLFERQNAKRLSQSAQKKHWPDYILNNHPNPFQVENYISGQACDHYNRFKEDFDIAQSLGHNAHRFSIEWSRIEPEEGKFNGKEIEHYREVIRALRERDMEPFVTLWHWTLPRWLENKGGILTEDFQRYFVRYAERLAVAFKNDVQFWFTINEPEIYCLNAYYRGRRPPQKNGFFYFYRGFNSLILAHRLAYRAMKKISSRFTIGIVCNLSDFKSSGGPVNAFLKVLFERFWNHRFLQKIKNEIDAIGLNFYFHHRIRYGLRSANEVISDVGWDLHPEGIESILRDLQVYERPIYITESGLADARDKNRAWFIKETIEAAGRALARGVPVRGYFHWSLSDNFEWDNGFWPRFGLVEIDYRTLERKIRPSAWEYKKIIENHFNV